MGKKSELTKYYGEIFHFFISPTVDKPQEKGPVERSRCKCLKILVKSAQKDCLKESFLYLYMVLKYVTWYWGTNRGSILAKTQGLYEVIATPKISHKCPRLWILVTDACISSKRSNITSYTWKTEWLPHDRIQKRPVRFYRILYDF